VSLFSEEKQCPHIILSAFDNYYLRAQQLRTLIRDDFDRLFTSPSILSAKKLPSTDQTRPTSSSVTVDFLLHPSAIRTAPPLEGDGTDSSLDSYVQDILTVPASLAGLPAISLPTGLGDDGFPLGISLVGQWGTDRRLLRVAAAIEDAL
jgi:aspartyl-tRNA(Asn)/glutamyl-tRNA(Gln) amidotransferase subunit A